MRGRVLITHSAIVRTGYDRGALHYQRSDWHLVVAYAVVPDRHRVSHELLIDDESCTLVVAKK